MTKKNIKDLSIQVNLNGLSFCILNRTTSTIDYLTSIIFDSKLPPNKILDELKKVLSTDTVFSDDFNEVLVIHQNELSTLVPEHLYDTSNHADYLKFNSKILQTDYISNDALQHQSIINVYVPYVNINNYIFETFGEFTYKHASTIFIDHILGHNSDANENEMHVNVSKNAIEVLVTANTKIQLYNRFDYNSPEDFIYYILFTVEQLDLNVETLKLKFSGAIKKDDQLYNIAYKYIRHVEFNTSKSYTLGDTVSLVDKHNHFIILNSF